eukprot:gene45637-55858_t
MNLTTVPGAWPAPICLGDMRPRRSRAVPAPLQCSPMTQKITPGTAVLLVIPPLLWAGNAVVGRLVHELIPPITLNFIRWVLAFAILLPLAHGVLRPDSPLWPHWRRYALLGLLGPVLGTGRDSPEREAVVAALNGVLGDYLVTTTNPLATPMSLRVAGPATGRVVVLAHGLCMNDLQWTHTTATGEVRSHAHALAAVGYTPVYVRYNTGLHTSDNGAALAAELEQLVAHWPVPVTDITVLAHSMGGLVTRSAVQQAGAANPAWLQVLKNIVFLGTPHHGAPLERAGNWVDVILGATPYSRPFAKLGQLRSAGITDLRHGHVLDDDSQGRGRFGTAERRADTSSDAPPRGAWRSQGWGQGFHDHRVPLPLPEGVACFTVGATLAPQR